MPTGSDHVIQICANSKCNNLRPLNATARWRFCSSACRQASYRARKRINDVDSAMLPVLDEELRAAMLRLLNAVHRMRDDLADDTRPKSSAVAHLVRLAQEVTEAAIARDRTAGVPWSVVADCLGLGFATTRRKYGPRIAEALSRLRQRIE
jgi:hypothetical protein